MKLTLFILLLLVGISGSTQVITIANDKSKWLPITTYGLIYRRVAVDSIFQPPHYADTPTIATVDKPAWKYSVGIRDVNSHLYIYNGSKWNDVTASGGGGIGEESDPIFSASPAFAVTTTNVSNWNTAFGWGNHAAAGYLNNTTGDVRYYTKTLADARYVQPSALTPYATTSSVASNYVPLTRTVAINGVIQPLSSNATFILPVIASFSTVGTSGPATYSGGTLNIPNYSLSGGGGSSTGDPDSVGGKPASFYLNRINHTGTQTSSTISDFNSSARALFSATGSLSYNSTTGVFSYVTPGNVSTFTNDVGYLTNTSGDARYSLLAHTHTFISLTSKPTTLAGYGITDAAALSHTHTFGSLTSRPTTISGYGITDAFTQAQADAIYAAIGHTHAFASLTAKPTTLSGYGITDAATSSGLATTNSNLSAEITNRTTADALKANLASPPLTGIPTTPTAAAGTNTTQIASTAHVFAERSNIATLTNKTIDADNNTIADLTVTNFKPTEIEIDGYVATGATVTVTGTTTKTPLWSTTVAANTLGPNGSFKLEYFLTINNTTNPRTISVEVNGITVGNVDVSSTTAFKCETVYYNRNSLTIGISPHPANNVITNLGSMAPWYYPGDGTTAPNNAGSAPNWAVSNTITIYATLTNTGDNVALKHAKLSTFK